MNVIEKVSRKPRRTVLLVLGIIGMLMMVVVNRNDAGPSAQVNSIANAALPGGRAPEEKISVVDMERLIRDHPEMHAFHERQARTLPVSNVSDSTYVLLRSPILKEWEAQTRKKEAELFRVIQPLIARHADEQNLSLVLDASARSFNEALVVVESTGCVVRWTPKTGPLVKIDFGGSAEDKREQTDESQTQTTQCGL